MANKTEKKNQPHKTGWDKICDFYASQAVAVGMIYSLGAAVVIIGAMFKILHLPGAGALLGAGMVTEAVLFIMGIFERPHPTYHWENVYPQLLVQAAVSEEDVEDVELDPLAGDINNIGNIGPKPAVVSGGNVASVSVLSDEQVKELQKGIDNLGKAASQLSSLGDVATASNGLVEKMQVAGKAAEAFAGTHDKLATATEDLAQQYQAVQTGMSAVNEQTKTYAQHVTTINTQLTSLNAAYELQLKDIQAQSAACQSQTATYAAQTDKLKAVSATVDALAVQAEQLHKTTAASAEVAAKYLAEQKKLAEQVADLNKVYGNMLNAL